MEHEQSPIIEAHIEENIRSLVDVFNCVQLSSESKVFVHDISAPFRHFYDSTDIDCIDIIAATTILAC